MFASTSETIRASVDNSTTPRKRSSDSSTPLIESLQYELMGLRISVLLARACLLPQTDPCVHITIFRPYINHLRPCFCLAWVNLAACKGRRDAGIPRFEKLSIIFQCVPT